jgi:decaprenyl-phosphate phosphoribosyltransferase
MAVLVTSRPRQWIKNALVVAAAGAAGALGHDDVPGRVAFACIGFCFISAGIYALNDSRDVNEDRHHPRKRRRPVAAGELPVRDAVALGLAWIISGLALCFAIRPLLGLVGLAYVALTLSYTYVWRHIIVLDIFAVAGGFVLRALAGGVAAPVTLSRWFVLVVSSAALFLAAGKRHAELVRVSRDEGGQRSGGPTAASRRVLSGYTPGGLRLLLGGSAGCALFGYCVWAFGLVDVDGVPWRLLTVVPFTICLLRYGSLIGAGAGEAPEELILGDRTLALSAIAWLFLFALSVHAATG